MPIHDWPEQERPREKLIARGPATLSDAELLALFLGSGFGGRDAVQTARDLLRAHGPLRVLLDRPARELARLPGLGPARSCALAAGLELAHRYLAAELQQGEAVGNNPVAVGRYLQHRLRGQAREIFMALFLDNRHRLIACEELFQGTINAAPVYPREVVRRALLHNAAAVILSHNHPSGDPTPASADISVTRVVVEAAKVFDISVHDHLIVGRGEVFSMRGRGLL